MIVLVIAAVLFAIALPAYQSQQLRARRSVAQAELMKIAARQEQYFINNRSYAANLADLGFADPWTVDSSGNQVAADAPGRVYSVSLKSQTATAFELEAVPQGRQADDAICATYRLTATGVRTVTGTGSALDCW